jgi:hypothetical protein
MVLPPLDPLDPEAASEATLAELKPVSPLANMRIEVKLLWLWPTESVTVSLKTRSVVAFGAGKVRSAEALVPVNTLVPDTWVHA